VTPLVVVLALIGGAWGLLADRIAARWPEHVHEHVHPHDGPDADVEHEHAHEPGDEPVPGKAWAHEHPHEHRADLPHGIVARRGVDWRTAVVAVIGAVALGAVAVRYPEPAETLLFGAWIVVLVQLLAIDLDQRLLPDVITLPLIPIAFVLALLGWNPLVPPSALPAAVVLGIVLPLLLYAFSIPFARGAFGQGDVKMLVSMGLVLGGLRLVYAIVAGVLVAGLVIVVLLALRRITLRTFIPYGPFLIIGAIWALLVVR
jgi:leader peptidase (prepilin peptidase)/N-methyltransferase